MSGHVLPQGDPESITCRWCRAPRALGPRGGRFCLTCDGRAADVAATTKKEKDQ